MQKDNNIDNKTSFKKVSDLKKVSDFLIEQINEGKLNHDNEQEKLAKELDELLDEIKAQNLSSLNTRNSNQGLFGRLFGKAASPNTNHNIKGFYIMGDVGRGKTMLMNAFYQVAKNLEIPSQRHHFHVFMRDVQASLNHLRQNLKSDEDIINKAADEVLKNGALICLDEFFVEHIADAMILGRLFTALFNKGAILVTTSNTQPDNLYKDGLNRPLFMPFIALLKTKIEIVNLNTEHDYREFHANNQANNYSSNGENAAKNKGENLATKQNDDINQRDTNPSNQIGAYQNWVLLSTPTLKSILREKFLDASRGVEPRMRAYNYLGRELSFRKAGGRAVWSSFKNLCEKELSKEDYIYLCRHFDVWIIEGVPQIDPNIQRNELRRFIVLIDILYDEKKRTFFSSEVELNNLLKATDYDAESSNEIKDFPRIRSRILEMGTKRYQDEARMQQENEM